MKQPNLLTLKEVADKLGIPLITLYTFIYDGRIKFYKLGKRYFIPVSEFKKLQKRLPYRVMKLTKSYKEARRDGKT